MLKLLVLKDSNGIRLQDSVEVYVLVKIKFKSMVYVTVLKDMLDSYFMEYVSLLVQIIKFY